MTDDHGADTGASETGANKGASARPTADGTSEEGAVAVAIDESAASGVHRAELTSIAQVTRGNHWASGRLFALLGVLALFVIGVAFCAAAIRGDADDVVKAVASDLDDTGVYDGIGVDGSGGTITVTGTVETEAARGEAGELALATPGVQRVINNLEVVPARDTTPITTSVSLPPTTEAPATPTTIARTATTVPTTTAPPPKAEADLNALDPITFNVNSAVITSEGRIVLDRAVTVLTANPDLSFEVGGHTDSDGDEAGNLDLSQRRAEAVIEYVVAQGVDAEQLTPRGYGEAESVTANDSAEAKAQNRRIEWTVQDG